MASAAEYRQRAQDCVQLAQAAKLTERRILLEMASAWLKLADRAEADATLLTESAKLKA